MFGNQYRYAVEVANEETGIYETVAIINEPYDILPMREEIKSFRVVIYRQDAKQIYRRGDFMEIELTGSTHEQTLYLVRSLNTLADIA